MQFEIIQTPLVNDLAGSISLLALIESIRIAEMSSKPSNASLQFIGTLDKVRPLFILVIIRIEINTATKVPLPPLAETPARKHIMRALKFHPAPNPPRA